MKRWAVILHANHSVDWYRNPVATEEKYHFGKHDYFTRPGAAYHSKRKRNPWTLWLLWDYSEYELYRYGHPEPLTLKDDPATEPIERTMKKLGDVNESRLIADILGKSGFDWSTFLFGVCAGAIVGLVGGLVAAQYLVHK